MAEQQDAQATEPVKEPVSDQQTQPAADVQPAVQEPVADQPLPVPKPHNRDKAVTRLQQQVSTLTGQVAQLTDALRQRTAHVPQVGQPDPDDPASDDEFVTNRTLRKELPNLVAVAVRQEVSEVAAVTREQAFWANWNTKKENAGLDGPALRDAALEKVQDEFPDAAGRTLQRLVEREFEGLVKEARSKLKPAPSPTSIPAPPGGPTTIMPRGASVSPGTSATSKYELWKDD